MSEHHTLADRLRSRTTQLGLTPARVAEMAGVNRSFVYDILRGRSARPTGERLDAVARVLKVDRDWLIHGIGEIEGTAPFVDNPDDAFVAIEQAGRGLAMGNAGAADGAARGPGRVYHFRRSWIRNTLKASPSQLRIMRVQGDSMAPTLVDGDAVLVDLTRRTATPAGLFVLDDGMGLVAKRLEHIPNSDPPVVRVISDNKTYSEYERAADAVDILGRIRWYAREL